MRACKESSPRGGRQCSGWPRLCSRTPEGDPTAACRSRSEPPESCARPARRTGRGTHRSSEARERPSGTRSVAYLESGSLQTCEQLFRVLRFCRIRRKGENLLQIRFRLFDLLGLQFREATVVVALRPLWVEIDGLGEVRRRVGHILLVEEENSDVRVRGGIRYRRRWQFLEHCFPLVELTVFEIEVGKEHLARHAWRIGRSGHRIESVELLERGDCALHVAGLVVCLCQNLE